MTLHLWESTPSLFVESDLPVSKHPTIIDHIPLAPPITSDDGQLHPSVTAPLPVIEGGWPFIMADPAWNFRSWVANANPESSRAAERHYRTMSLAEIGAMPVKDIAAPNAHLAMWITSPFLVAGLHLPIMRAWGFKPSSTFVVWAKLKRSAGKAQMQMISLDELRQFLHFGQGHTTRKNIEVCVLGRRGNAKRIDRAVPELIIEPVREHSRKPDEAYARALRYADGPHLELFSREDRDGWTTWGNETGKLNDQ